VYMVCCSICVFLLFFFVFATQDIQCHKREIRRTVEEEK
jgi:hypothetical protein